MTHIAHYRFSSSLAGSAGSNAYLWAAFDDGVAYNFLVLLYAESLRIAWHFFSTFF